MSIINNNGANSIDWTWLESEIKDKFSSQKDFARRGNLDEANLSRLIKGSVKEPRAGTVVAIANTLNIPVRQVLERAGFTPALPQMASEIESVVHTMQQMDKATRQDVRDFALLWLKRQNGK